ncbi:TPA: HEAT repeat domain-containing protein [Legionella pneumophila]|nr:HEAT repeat domain-containing protein [Legionella pneumophila]HBD9375633.1 HEAT repeat domain-containing protein [Legionella pneumophila]HDV6634017.1 HEAT repeat domain-containing protein [Legionella pneumophila]
MRNYFIVLLVFVSLFSQAIAAPVNIDVYGVSTEIEQKIFSHCKKDLNNYLKLQEQVNNASKTDLEKILMQQAHLKKSALECINQLDQFSFSNISVVYYPDTKNNYVTIDLVKTSESYRLPTSPKRMIKKKIYHSQNLNRLFETWKKYEESNLEQMRAGSLNLQNKSCPVLHCIWGFDQKEIKDYLPKLKEGAMHYKNELIEIILHGADDIERGLAIFILAHSSQYNELAHLLTELISDSSAHVRNNSMRVLGAIVSKKGIKSLDIDAILNALNYPNLTDRNKAAYVLLNIVLKDPSTHKKVIQRSGNTLIHLLKLKQPNNHDFAYRILQEISHQHYSEMDYQSWQKWIDEQKS